MYIVFTACAEPDQRTFSIYIYMTEGLVSVLPPCE